VCSPGDSLRAFAAAEDWVVLHSAVLDAGCVLSEGPTCPEERDWGFHSEPSLVGGLHREWIKGQHAKAQQ
jgi:hypothetical protein